MEFLLIYMVIFHVQSKVLALKRNIFRGIFNRLILLSDIAVITGDVPKI